MSELRIAIKRSLAPWDWEQENIDSAVDALLDAVIERLPDVDRPNTWSQPAYSDGRVAYEKEVRAILTVAKSAEEAK